MDCEERAMFSFKQGNSAKLLLFLVVAPPRSSPILEDDEDDEEAYPLFTLLLALL